MRPLARWTIGNVRDVGFDILKKSISLFQRIYPEFDCIICYNEIEPDRLPLSVDHFHQTHECCDIPVKPFAINAWKLFPPRLRIGARELFIDNDLVIHKRIPQIDEFLNSDRFLCYGHCHRSAPAYGVFSHYITNGFKLNSGIFGLPVGFDFEREIIQLLEQEKLKEWDTFDEQGLVASILVPRNPLIITPDEISNCWRGYVPAEYGCHFCGHNTVELPAWKDYLLSTM